MNPLVFNAHQNRPPRMLPVNWRAQRCLFNNFQHRGTHLIAVVFDLRGCRPVITAVIQVIPAHLIHTHRKDGFKMWIDTLFNQFAEQQFVDEKCRGMAIVKNQRMAQRNRFVIKGLIAVEAAKQ